MCILDLHAKMHNLDVGAKSVHENVHFGSACEILEFRFQHEIL